MPSCNTYHFTWVSRTFDMGYLFTAAPAKELLLLTLDEGYLLTATVPELQRVIAPLGPPVPAQPLLLGRKAMQNSAQTTAQLHSSHMLESNVQNSPS